MELCLQLWGNITEREGWGGDNATFTATYVNNKRVGLTYDVTGNLTNDGGQNFTYDVTGQAATASYSGYLLQQYYDGDGLRVKKTENSTTTYYLRSSVLGGQVVAEISPTPTPSWQRGYIYLGGELIAVQYGGVYWVHQDPLVKSKRVTNSSGSVVSVVELDPWGGNTNRNSNDAFQPHKFTNYERDGNASDEAMFRRYNRWWSRFDQPDPYDGSYDFSDPQSFNRYPYAQNDPVNLLDPSGMDPEEGWRAFNCSTRADLGVGILDMAFGWQGPCSAGGGGAVDSGGGGGGVPEPQKPRKEKEVDPQVQKCDELRAAILSKAGKLLNELRKYDPVLDGAGGPVWQPGGHFVEIINLQRGIKNDLTRYIEECIKNKGGPSGPPIPHWIDEAANRRVPLPVIRYLRYPRKEESHFPWDGIVPAGGAALVIYLIISEGSRIVFPPGNLVPVP
jgi:RHS repeat-associated protein